MPHKEDLVFKSKAQADRLRVEFIERYGEKDGLLKFGEIERRSPHYEDLPEKIPQSFKHPKKAPNISRKLGKKWRGI